MGGDDKEKDSLWGEILYDALGISMVVIVAVFLILTSLSHSQSP